MPYPATADHNVPFIGPRARYKILTSSPTWVRHQMDGTAALNGADPSTAALTAPNLDPAVTAGMALYSALITGGLFTLLSKYKRPMIVEAIDMSAGVTMTLVKPNGSPSRPLPGSVPFAVAPNEVLKATGGANGGYAAVLVREAGEKLL